MKQHRNILIWHLTTLFGNAAFILPIWVIFNTEILGLTNAQAFLLGTITYGVSAFFEIPTGSWADKYGRAKIYQLGTVFYIISVASFIFFTNFYILLILQVVGALGFAMQSGCREALVHDSISGEDKDSSYVKTHSVNHALLFVSRTLTVIIGGVAYSLNPRAPFVLGVAMFSICFGISLFFKEVRLDTPTELSNWKHIKQTLKLMWGLKVVVILLLLIVFYRFISEALFALYQPYFKSIGLTIESFGIFYAIISIFSGLGSLITGWLLQKFSAFKSLFIMMCALSLTLCGMLLQVSPLTYIVIIPSAIAFGCALNIINTSIQKVIRSRHQTTALSIASFINTVFYLIAAVTVGISLDYISVQQANLLLAVLSVLFMIPAFTSLRLRLGPKVN